VAHAATPGIGAVLDEAAEHSYKAWAIFEGEKLSKSWNGMLETIMTGKTAAQRLSLNNSFDLMSRAPENVRIFNAAMVDLTRLRHAGDPFSMQFRPHFLLDGCGRRIKRTNCCRRKGISRSSWNSFRSS
jgi:hypothetical protein